MNKNHAVYINDKNKMVSLKFGEKVVEVTEAQFQSFCRNVRANYPVRLTLWERITGKYWGI